MHTTYKMLSKKLNRLILVCVLQMLFPANCNSVFLNESSRTRQKRTLNFYFPYNSCYALAIVLSLPLDDLPAGRSVFCSYNFETNFYFPYYDNANGLIPLPFTWINEPGANAGTKHRIDLPPAYRQFNGDDEGNDEKVEKEETEEIQTLDNETLHHNVTSQKLNKKKSSIHKPKIKVKKTKNKSRQIRSLLNNYFMSRRRFYKMMESKMDRSGLQGRDCILKAICETSDTRFGLNNGLIGSVMDILFLPSSSIDEKLPKRYYRAEINGKSGNCHLYNQKCPKSLFDFISKII